ncbi:response regulator [Paenibacillus sp. JNUCC31]|uniref:response regulator transcription factor n=1 Tax=Paenibacillus sp. JNUCC-31 TaxID=2777983 RepID=UPI0017843200|nr:response regulator [Paenibacillus sp. JNUCC-31]QOS77885.1 response regulator [Paenibacillus sp. JNUCC-31]
MHQVLLVDDEVYARKGLRKLIRWEACGFEVIGEADDGDEAYEQIERLQPDVVITDIRMPETDGLELIRRTSLDGDQNGINGKMPYFIIVSGYNDFTYAQQAVRYGVQDYILKPIDEVELEATLCRLSAVLKQHKSAEQEKRERQYMRCLEQLMYGEADSSVAEQWLELTDTHSGDMLAYLLFEHNPRLCSDVSEITYTGEEDVAQLGHYESFQQIVQAVLKRMYPQDTPMHLKQHGERVGVLLTGKHLRTDANNLRKTVEKIQFSFTEMENTRVCIYAGATCQDPLLIGHAYQTALKAIAYKFITEDDGVVLFDEVQHAQVQWMHTDHEKQQQLLRLMEEQQMEAMEVTLGDWFTELRASCYAPAAVTSAVHQLVSAVVSILKSVQADVKTMTTLQPVLDWQSERGRLADALQLLNCFMEEAARRLAEQRQQIQKGSMPKIKSYIEENYSKNISLKSIASEFYMNPVYLGQRFRKVYGMYFNDFLLQLRIEEAKRLLRQTDLRVYEVAERVGFGSSDYFATQFEKTEASSPTEYRNRLMGEG